VRTFRVTYHRLVCLGTRACRFVGYSRLQLQSRYLGVGVEGKDGDIRSNDTAANGFGSTFASATSSVARVSVGKKEYGKTSANEIPLPKLLFRQAREVMYSPSPTVTNRPLGEWIKDVENISVEPISVVERGTQQPSVNEGDGDEEGSEIV